MPQGKLQGFKQPVKLQMSPSVFFLRSRLLPSSSVPPSVEEIRRYHVSPPGKNVEVTHTLASEFIAHFNMMLWKTTALEFSDNIY